MTDRVSTVRDAFVLRYGRVPQLYQAPGRVNLIGEHTDYNDGFVMPAAIDFRTTVAIATRSDRTLRLHSANFGESVDFPLPRPGAHLERPQPAGHWSDYACGVAVMLEAAGYALPGADLLIQGEVPIGSGLSSSAALEVAVGYALLDTAGHAVLPVELALLCQKAENEYVGMRCGIMDQFTSSCGRAGSAILLDCRSLEHRWLPLPGNDAALDRRGGPDAPQLVICNTMVRHRLAGGEYNSRREECEQGVRLLGAALPGIRALRDVTLPQLEACSHLLPQKIYRRCRHVVSENARVIAAAAALERADFEAFGQRLDESHRSLRDDFEVSCDELDLMVSLARQVDGTFGARMTGGGFGGCTVNFVRTSQVEAFRRAVTAGYLRANGLTPEIYVCQTANGAGRAGANA